MKLSGNDLSIRYLPALGCFSYLNESAVSTFLPHKAIVGAALRDATSVNHKDLVRIADGRKPMRNRHNGLVCRKLCYGMLYERLVLGINACRGLVQDDDRCILQKGTRNGDPLLLASRQCRASFADARVKPLRQLHDEVVAARAPCGLLDLFPGGPARPNPMFAATVSSKR